MLPEAVIVGALAATAAAVVVEAAGVRVLGLGVRLVVLSCKRFSFELALAFGFGSLVVVLVVCICVVEGVRNGAAAIGAGEVVDEEACGSCSWSPCVRVVSGDREVVLGLRLMLVRAVSFPVAVGKRKEGEEVVAEEDVLLCERSEVLVAPGLEEGEEEEWARERASKEGPFPCPCPCPTPIPIPISRRCGSASSSICDSECERGCDGDFDCTAGDAADSASAGADAEVDDGDDSIGDKGASSTEAEADASASARAALVDVGDVRAAMLAVIAEPGFSHR